MLFLDCFEILLIVCDDPVNNVGNHRVVKRINCTRNILSPSPVMIVADPFLVVKDETLFLFYEEYRYRERGIIKMVSTNDLIHWSEPETVLKESFHLSYPFVFMDNGQWYMMPETSAVHEVRLYKAVNNQFDKFEPFCSLLSRDQQESSPKIDFCDSSLTNQDGNYFLFTTVNCGRGNELHLFSSDKIDGTYIEHPQSPIIVDDRFGRNGGSLIEWKGNLYRFAQDCDGEYGKDVNIFNVNALSKSHYSESLLHENILTKNGFRNGHQYSFVRFKGLNIVALDQKFRIPYIGCKLKRLLQGMIK